MNGYKNLIERIMLKGADTDDRTGVGSRYIFGEMEKFDMSDGSFPATTIRPVPLRWVFEETMFFLRGRTQTKELEEKGISIWKGNTTREFLDNRGMTNYPEGEIGKGYGFQWRNFNGIHQSEITYPIADVGINGTDQITILAERLRTNPLCRRHIVSAWNPAQLDEMALPPCHILQQYDISPDGKLSLLFWMRSNDVMYGLPFNIAQYAFLLTFFAKMLDLQPGMLVYQCGNSHIYKNQMDMAIEVLNRSPKQSPQIEIKRELNNLDDIISLEWEDIEVIDYDPHPDVKNKPPMAV